MFVVFFSFVFFHSISALNYLLVGETSSSEPFVIMLAALAGAFVSSGGSDVLLGAALLWGALRFCLGTCTPDSGRAGTGAAPAAHTDPPTSFSHLLFSFW